MTDSSSPSAAAVESHAPAFVFIEHVVWIPDVAWRNALEALSSRFARAHPFDAAAALAHNSFADQVASVLSWGDAAGVDVDRELGRYFDEHMSMHVRPNPAITRAVRTRAAHNPVHALSALPPRAAESIARHAGIWRSVSELHAPLTADQVTQLIADAAPSVVVRSADDL